MDYYTDNDTTGVLLNGVPIPHTHSPQTTMGHASTEDAALLVPGRNTVTFGLENWGGPSGLNLSGSFSYEVPRDLPHVMFYDDFGGNLSAWTGKLALGGSHSGAIVDDPLHPGNKVLSFTATSQGGDVFSTTELHLEQGMEYVFSLDYLGKEISGVSPPDNFGGFAGLSDVIDDPGLAMNDPAQDRTWIFGTSANVPYLRAQMIDDGEWHHYSYAFTWDRDEIGARDDILHIMLEDFNEFRIAGDVFFDNIKLELVRDPAALDGDLNGDGFVGRGDLDAVLMDWGNSPPLLSYTDPSGDDLVGQGDLDIVLSNWGKGTSPVPEPATLSLLTLGGLALMRRKRR